MANGLVPNPRRRNFWFESPEELQGGSFFQNLAQQSEQDGEGLFGIQVPHYKEFERPGQQALMPAPGVRQPEPLAPAPMLRRPGETRINGGDIPGVRTDAFPTWPMRTPAPTDLQPSPSGYESLVRAPRLQAPESTLESYGEQYRRGHEKPELAPAPGLSKKRRIGAAIAAFAAEFGRPGAGYRVGQQILYGPRERTEAEHERKLLTWKGGLEEARERDIGEGRRVRRELGQEQLRRLRITPLPGQEETEREAFERRKREAADLGLEPGSSQYLEYVAERDLAPQNEIALFLQDPKAYEQMLAARGRHRVDRRTATEIQIDLYEKDPELYEQIFDRVGIRNERQMRLKIIEAAMRLSESVSGQVDESVFTQKLAELSAIVGVELQNQEQPEAGKTATRQEVEAFAQEKGISYAEAEQQYKAAGYTIQ
jgi:hypothetical protein